MTQSSEIPGQQQQQIKQSTHDPIVMILDGRFWLRFWV